MRSLFLASLLLLSGVSLNSAHASSSPAEELTMILASPFLVPIVVIRAIGTRNDNDGEVRSTPAGAVSFRFICRPDNLEMDNSRVIMALHQVYLNRQGIVVTNGARSPYRTWVRRVQPNNIAMTNRAFAELEEICNREAASETEVLRRIAIESATRLNAADGRSERTVRTR